MTGPGQSPAPPQLLILSYHKSGSTLFHRIMHKVARRFRRSIRVRHGLVDNTDRDTDIVLLPHALLTRPPTRAYRGVRIIRDPRDIWVSGYLYHLRTDEEWCVNTDLDPRPPITLPQVDFPMLRWPEPRKRAWLARLNGQSYQQNLRNRDRDAGLAFELDGYTGCTLEAMRAWSPMPGVLDVKLEAIHQTFDKTMRGVFCHLGLSDADAETAVALAATEDVNRMTDAAIAASPQLHGRALSKWREVLSEAQVAIFEQRYGDLLSNYR